MKLNLLFLSMITLSLASCGSKGDPGIGSIGESSYSFYTKNKDLAYLVDTAGIQVDEDASIQIEYLKQCAAGKLYVYKLEKSGYAAPEAIYSVYVGREKLLNINNGNYHALFITTDGTCKYPAQLKDSSHISFEDGIFLEDEIREIQSHYNIVSPYSFTDEERLIKAANIELEEGRYIIMYCSVECNNGWFYIYRIGPVYGGASEAVQTFLTETSIITFPDTTYRTAYVTYDMTSIVGRGSKFAYPTDWISEEQANQIKEEYIKSRSELIQ